MANMIVTITEALTLNGVDQGGTYATTVSGLNEVSKRIVKIPVSGSGVVTLYETTGDAGSVIAAGKFLEASIEYGRITNIGAVSINLQIARDDNSDATDDECAWFVLEAGKSFLLHKHDAGFDAVAGDADSPTLDSVTDVRCINVDGSTEGLVEIFITST